MTRRQKMMRALSAALWDTELISARITLSMGEVAWAVMLFWAGELFSRPTYKVMSHVMGEEAWGVVFMLSAATQITIVLLDDFHSIFARYFAAWNACLWVFVVWSMLASVSPPPAAIGGEIALSISACWIWVRPYILAKGYSHAYRA
jgi:hypothetical protein